MSSNFSSKSQFLFVLRDQALVLLVEKVHVTNQEYENHAYEQLNPNYAPQLSQIDCERTLEKRRKTRITTQAPERNRVIR